MAIVVKRDGTGQTGQMDQATTQTYLRNVLDDANRNASLGQCLNDVFNGSGKATGAYQFANLAVWHASSGAVGAANGVTLFWTMTGTVASIFAMGRHSGPTAYRIDVYGQAGTPFALGATINL
jgi:hypothetical protein